MKKWTQPVGRLRDTALSKGTRALGFEFDLCMVASCQSPEGSSPMSRSLLMEVR